MTLIDSCWHNRFIRSRSGIWSACRNGVQEQKFGTYQRPDSKLVVHTSVNASYFIDRAYLNFHTQGAGPVISARLGLYVTDIPAYNFALIITKGLWDEPVTPEDFGLQTDETTILGQKSTDDMVLNQYNWIDLNEAGIAWINQRPIEINQHESFDWQKIVHYGFTTAPVWRSQSFTPQTTHTITAVRLRMKREGNPGTLNVRIYAADANHCPTGPVLASGTIDANTFTTATWGDWYLIDLGAGCTVTADTEYCIAANLPDGVIPNYVYWEGCSASQYPNGTSALSDDDGSTWTPSATVDLYFIEYETATVGGTKFCLRTSSDAGDVPPVAGAIYTIYFHSAQKGDGYLPLLDLTYIVVPTVTTNPATNVIQELATLNGLLDGDGGEACDVRFQYGLTSGYGTNTAWQPGINTGATFEQAISGLNPNTTYHFRAQAKNSAGTANGADRTFTTLVAIPTVTTDAATEKETTSATLNGTLANDGGEACDCGFEWGETIAYGNTTPTQSKTTGESFSQVIRGLFPGTSYHFRAFATNSKGTGYGSDTTFTAKPVMSRAYALARREL